MPGYHLFSCNNEGAESFWVTAPDEREARQLVAANIPGAADVMDAKRFDCVTSTRPQPSVGTIYRRSGGPVKTLDA